MNRPVPPRLIGLGCVLTLVPIAFFVLMLEGLIPAEGGHGLGEWFFDGVCFVIVLAGTLLNGFLALRGKRLSLVMALVGCAAMGAFVVEYGIPFAH